MRLAVVIIFGIFLVAGFGCHQYIKRSQTESIFRDIPVELAKTKNFVGEFGGACAAARVPLSLDAILTMRKTGVEGLNRLPTASRRRQTWLPTPFKPKFGITAESEFQGNNTLVTMIHDQITLTLQLPGSYIYETDEKIVVVDPERGKILYESCYK